MHWIAGGTPLVCAETTAQHVTDLVGTNHNDISRIIKQYSTSANTLTGASMLTICKEYKITLAKLFLFSLETTAIAEGRDNLGKKLLFPN